MFRLKEKMEFDRSYDEMPIVRVTRYAKRTRSFKRKIDHVIVRKHVTYYYCQPSCRCIQDGIMWRRNWHLQAAHDRYKSFLKRYWNVTLPRFTAMRALMLKIFSKFCSLLILQDGLPSCSDLIMSSACKWDREMYRKADDKWIASYDWYNYHTLWNLSSIHQGGMNWSTIVGRERQWWSVEELFSI